VTYNATKGAADEETLKQISIQSQQQGDAISISTVNTEDVNGRVNFDVYVPRQSTLHVSSGDGALNLDGVTGQITLRSGDGPIEVANGGGQLQLNTGDGMIRVIKFEDRSMRARATARLRSTEISMRFRREPATGRFR
jgi:DUF4097 and DUF4098 domain-containing protein YvlB